MILLSQEDCKRYGIRVAMINAIGAEATGVWRCPTCGKWGYLLRDSKIWGDDTSEAGLITLVRQKHKSYSPFCPDVDLTGAPRLIL